MSKHEVTDDQVILIQAKMIIELTLEVTDLRNRCLKAVQHIVCIGGPLNDNTLKFTPVQQEVFQSILDELE